MSASPAQIMKWETEARDAQTDLKRGMGLMQKALERLDRIERELKKLTEPARNS